MSINKNLLIKPKLVPPLDEAFRPAALFHREFQNRIEGSRNRESFVVGLERSDGTISRFETYVFSDGRRLSQENLFICERLVKFLLWQRGGWKLYLGGPKYIGEYIAECYLPSGKRAFDTTFMGEKVYQKPLKVEICEPARVPPAKEKELSIGRNLDGCRIGFDLGASDIKVSALVNGDVIFSSEIEWEPRSITDPACHYENLRSAINVAASKLPHVDVIGGSSAGVIINNCPMIASLFESVPEERYGEVHNIFNKLQKEIGVPVEVINDGEIAALAGSMSLGKNSLLGIALGSSEAAGYITSKGNITNWLNELAFAPIDYNPEAPIDKWSGDYGCGSQYLSQQCVFRLLPRAGIEVPLNTSNAQKLEYVLSLLEMGHTGALSIWQTIGIYMGYAIAHYAVFYEMEHILLLGRCTSGIGGQLILEGAAEVLEKEFPEISDRTTIHLPDEKSRRVGQSIAAASLPKGPIRS